MSKNSFLSLILITVLSVMLNAKVQASPYSFGTNNQCGGNSTAINLAPNNIVHNISLNNTNSSISPMTLLTPWIGGTTGTLTKAENDCENKYDYDPTAYGISTWSVAEQAPTGKTVNSDGIEYPVYATSLPEFGYIMYVKDTTSTEPDKITTTTPQKLWDKSASSDGNKSFSRTIQAKIRLVTLTEVQPGEYQIAAQRFGDVFMTNEEDNYTNANRHMFSIPININNFSVTLNTSTCNIGSDSSNQIITMPTASINSFNGIGSKTALTNFQIRVFCDAGVSVYAALTDANDINNQTDILSLSPNSKASGVGIQIAHDSSTVIFGPPPSSFNANNQWFVGGGESSGAMTYLMPFSAQYIQTNETIETGSLSAQMIITLNYQ